MQLTPYHTSPFDAIRQINENGQEYWSAREIQPPLGYARWENFKETIEKAMIACKNSGHNPTDHFRDVTKIVEAGATSKPIQDYHFTRYACYLVAMNGDPRKPEISAAQTYFAIKTREAELAQSSQLDAAQLKTLEQTINDLRNEIHDMKQLITGQKQVSRKRIRIVATDEKQAKILSKMHYLRAKGVKRVSPAIMYAYLKSIDKYEIATIMNDLAKQKKLKKFFTTHAVNGLYELI